MNPTPTSFLQAVQSMHFSELISLVPSIQHDAACNLKADPLIKAAAPNNSAGQSEISFYTSTTAKELLTHDVSALILPLNSPLKTCANREGIAWVESPNPQLSFAEILDLLHPEKRIEPGIDESAQIHPTAAIAADAAIGALVVIGPNTTVGKGCKIHAGVIIHDQVSIGDHTEIHSGAVLHRRSRIGGGCVIHSNAVVGAEGFGFVRTENGLRKMPQTGVVVLEDKVEIGCNSCVDRPAMGETRIGRGTKIDNLVQIGHGVHIGDDCALASQVGIAGAATLGSRVVLGGQVGVADKICLGDDVVAYAKAAIPVNIAAGESVAGIPAIPARVALRCAAAFKSLPEMTRTLRRMQDKINALQDKINQLD